MRRLLVLLALYPLLTAAAPRPATWTLRDCVNHALQQSATIASAEARVDLYRARLGEVESIFYPKLMSLLFVAPTYTVRGSHLDPDVTAEYDSLKDWGPYTRLQALLVQPLTTFGRADALAEAASERIAVEEARVREAELVLVLEVEKLYYAHLFALSMAPALEKGNEVVTSALDKANELYAEGTGDVKQSDVMRLQYVKLEIQRLALKASNGAKISLAALKHTMGMQATEALVLDHRRLPRLTEAPPIKPLSDALQAAALNRPEWAQLEHGEKALEALRKSELLASLPVLFLGANLQWDWTPMRDPADNAHIYDPFNQLVGGVALGLQLQLDPARSLARADQAAARTDEVRALKEFAKTGIPLRVLHAYQALAESLAALEITKSSVKTARKWMLFAGSAYMTGTGEARDLLEGVAAFLQAKHVFYQTLFNYYVNQGKLSFATGKSVAVD